MANISAIKLPNGTSYNLRDGVSGYITAAGAPVQSVNGKTGTITLTASDVNALPSNTTVSVVTLKRW